MSSFGVRPTFGANQTKQTKKDRPEIGAIWERMSKSNFKYMNIRLKLSKKKLLDLINSNEEVISVNLVAFPNKDLKENTNRPNFRIYEESNSED